MGLFDWLITPGGQTATHAVVLLIVAVAGYINHRAIRQNSDKLNGHLHDHMTHEQ